MLGNISDMCGKEGETGKSVQAVSSSEMMLARCPRLLGGLLEEEHPRPMWKCNLEIMVVAGILKWRIWMSKRSWMCVNDCIPMPQGLEN